MLPKAHSLPQNHPKNTGVGNTFLFNLYTALQSCSGLKSKKMTLLLSTQGVPTRKRKVYFTARAVIQIPCWVRIFMRKSRAKHAEQATAVALRNIK